MIFIWLAHHQRDLQTLGLIQLPIKVELQVLIAVTVCRWRRPTLPTRKDLSGPQSCSLNSLFVSVFTADSLSPFIRPSSITAYPAFRGSGAFPSSLKSEGRQHYVTSSPVNLELSVSVMLMSLDCWRKYQEYLECTHSQRENRQSPHSIGACQQTYDLVAVRGHC